MLDRLVGLSVILVAGCMAAICGCGLAYEAGSQIKTGHMEDRLKQGETTLEVHKDWGEPDLRQQISDNAEIWSYARRPNNKDVAAEIFYTSTKSGDESRFLDLKFIDSKLVSWSESERAMPTKQGSGFNYGFGSGNGTSPLQHY